MSEKERNKAGFHKEISSIFKGVRIPQNGGGQEPSGTPASERTDHSEPKPPATEPQKPEAPKLDQVTQSLPISTGAQQPKADIDDTEKNTSGSKGVPLWQIEGPEQPCETPVPERTGCTEPKPQKPDQVTQSLPGATPEHADHTEPKPPATEVQKPDARQPDGKHVQDHAGEPPAAATAKDRQPPPGPQIQKPNRPEQPAAKAAPPEKPKAPGYVVHSGDPQGATVKRPLVKPRIKKKLSTPESGASKTKQKTMAVMMPVLFIILLVLVFKGSIFGSKVGKTEASGQDNVSSVATADSNYEIDWEIPAPYPATLRDPMRLDPVEDAQTETETETGTLATLIVKGILYSEDSRSAVIGSQIVHEGDRIRGATVVRIRKDSIEFEMNGKRWTQAVR